MVIEAGSELTLSAGGSFIRIDASGVTFKGASIKLNFGRLAGRGWARHRLLPVAANWKTSPAKAAVLQSATGNTPTST